MVRRRSDSPKITIPAASRQVAFHQLLVGARKTWLVDALSGALRRIDPAILRSQIGTYVPADAQRILAASGVRDEQVFPTPVVLETKPALVGYYRLLLGVSQKTIYGTGTGMGQFKRMEMRDLITDRQRDLLPEFCRAMSEGLAELVRQVSPALTQRDVSELPLLTIGAQFQGSNNNAIGQKAVAAIFLSIREIVRDHIESETDHVLHIKNSTGRRVEIILASDPDVRIVETVGGSRQHKVAMEIKGGTDRSNAHNRAGEAEKSHQKARALGFRDFWTIIATKGLDVAKLRIESPTTRSWFDAAQVLGRDGADWDDFRDRIAGQVGVPL